MIFSKTYCIWHINQICLLNQIDIYVHTNSEITFFKYIFYSTFLNQIEFHCISVRKEIIKFWVEGQDWKISHRYSCIAIIAESVNDQFIRGLIGE